MFVRGASSDHSAESQVPEDPARGLRRLLAVLVVLALAAAGVAFALSRPGSDKSAKSPRPALFPTHFSAPSFVTGSAVLVSSYDVAAASRRTTAKLTARGNVYLVVLCHAGTVHLAFGSLTNSGPCTGKPSAAVGLNLTRDITVTATVSAPQTTRWGVAIYR